jgi:lysophospholipase L1-like esterase
VRTILCYGDSNTWGCIPEQGDGPARRLGPDERWPGVLRRELGEGYGVVEEGLNGRTTVWDDPVEPYRNGRDFLMPCLLSHHPLDLVVVLLGTNDLSRSGVTARDIAAGAGTLVDDIVGSECGRDAGPPLVLLICPPPFAQLGDEFRDATERSRELAPHYAAVAEARSCAFLDAGAHITSSDVDGIHLELDQHQRLGTVVADRARALLGRFFEPV